MLTLWWEFSNESSGVCYEVLPHPHKPRVRAFLSVADPDDFNRCRIAIERAFDYGKVSPELRAALTKPEGEE